MRTLHPLCVPGTPHVPTPGGALSCLPQGLWGLTELRARCLGGPSREPPVGPSALLGGAVPEDVPVLHQPCPPPRCPWCRAAENSKSGKSHSWSSCPLPCLPLLQHPSPSPPSAPLSYFLWAPLLLCGLELVPTLPWTPSPTVNCQKTMSGELPSLGDGGCEGRGDSIKMEKGRDRDGTR